MGLRQSGQSLRGCVHQVAVHEHCSKTVRDRFVLAYTPGVLRVFCSDGFPCVIAPTFSTPAFSTPAFSAPLYIAQLSQRSKTVSNCPLSFGTHAQVSVDIEVQVADRGRRNDGIGSNPE